MTIREMHYDFAMKLNKVDSRQSRNFSVPEKDWLLNEAAELYVKLITEPRNKAFSGFEITQRATDNISPLVVAWMGRSYTIPEVPAIPATPTTPLIPAVPAIPAAIVYNKLTLPNNYVRYISSTVIADKGNCIGQHLKVRLVQHDDEFQYSPFDSSSFEWRVINAAFQDGTLQLFPTDFTVKEFHLMYRRKLNLMYNGPDHVGSFYNLPGQGISNTTSTPRVNCELPEDTHREIVDLAVLIAAGQIGDPTYQYKLAKFAMSMNTPVGSQQQQYQQQQQRQEEQ